MLPLPLPLPLPPAARRPAAFGARESKLATACCECTVGYGGMS